MKKNKIRNKFIHTTLKATILLTLLLNMIPIQGIIIEPGVEFEIGNETYTVNQTMDFSRIMIIEDTGIVFNNTGFNVTAPNNILITLDYIDNDILGAGVDTKVVGFYADTIGGDVWMNISGLKTNIDYHVYKDSVFFATYTSNSTGNIAINCDSWSEFLFDIYVAENIAPTISNPFPSDGATDISALGSPISIYAYDADGDTMRTDIWTNFTSSWTQVAGWDVRLVAPSGSRELLNDGDDDGDWDTYDWDDWWTLYGWQGNGSRGFIWNYSVTDDWAMTATDTKYWWSVNCTDNTTWTNATYSFTTGNAAPTQSSPSPNNGATGVSVSLASVSITLADAEGTFDWTITTSPNVGSDSANDESDGIKTCAIAGLNYEGHYYWTVTAYDGTLWTNATYDFTVEEDTGGPPPNSAPVISEEYPTDESTHIELYPYCHIKVTDANIDDTDINFYSSTDGITYTWRQKNSTVPTGTTVYWQYTQANLYDTLYYWKVTANDGTINISEFYNFTTDPNIPVISAYYPGNESIEIPINETLSVTIFDYQGHTMNITWRNKIGTLWYDFAYNNSITNGTYTQRALNFTKYNTLYEWGVNITDGYVWINTTYKYTTEINPVPTASSPIPYNNEKRVSLYLTELRVTITDSNSALFNYTIETVPDIGSIAENNVADGRKTCTISGLIHATTYTWYINATDGEDWGNTTYRFTTLANDTFDIGEFKNDAIGWFLGPYEIFIDDLLWPLILLGVILGVYTLSGSAIATLAAIFLTFAAFGAKKGFIENPQISMIFSLIAAVLVALMILGLFLSAKRR